MPPPMGHALLGESVLFGDAFGAKAERMGEKATSANMSKGSGEGEGGGEGKGLTANVAAGVVSLPCAEREDELLVKATGGEGG